MTKQSDSAYSNAWSCEHGCDLSSRTCKHLERLLPQLGDARMPLDRASGDRVTFDVVNESVPFAKRHLPAQERGYDEGKESGLEYFESLCRSFGFHDAWDIELLTAYYFYGQPQRQIVAEYGYTGKTTVQHRLKRLHELARERGFKRKPRSGK